MEDFAVLGCSKGKGRASMFRVHSNSGGRLKMLCTGVKDKNLLDHR